MSQVLCHLRSLRVIGTALLATLVTAIALNSASALTSGNRVQASSSLNVRSSPAGTLLGTQPSGALGTIVSGPQTATLSGISYVWWQVNWDNNPDGWSIQDGIVLVAPPAPSLSSPTDGAVITGTSVTLTWNAVSGAGAYSVGLRDLSTNVLFGIALITGTSTTQSVVAGHSYRWDVASCVSLNGGDNISNCPNRSGNRTFSATSVTNYTVTLSAAPSNGGTVSGGGTVAAGTSRTASAVANTGYKFVGWTESGSTVSTSTSYTFIVNSNRALVANFSSTNTNYAIVLSASPTSGGSVSGAGSFLAGSSRTVSATANSGFNFANWTENGAVVSTSASYSFILSNNRVLVANFTPSSYTITLTPSTSAGGAVSGAGTFPAGSSRTVSATLNNGYAFAGWVENGVLVSASLSYTFTLTSNRNIVAAFAFMASPLACGDPNCTFKYSQGAYTPGILNSVLDHSLFKNLSGNWQYGKKSTGGGDGVVLGFTGERASGSPKPTDETCIGGTIYLKPTPNAQPLTNAGGCGSGYASYDEHPGYDYRAASATPVMAVAAGTIVSVSGEYCYKTFATADACSSWGWVGIDHGNGYVSQYGHLSKIYVKPGQVNIKQGDVIGLSGSTAPPPTALNPHLHFEVLKILNGQYVFLDPYGWAGAAGADPLANYSGTTVQPTRLWK